MQIAIIQNTPSTGETKIAQALRRVGFSPVEIFNESQLSLADYAGFILLESALTNPIYLTAFQQAVEMGKPVLGIGEGAKFLVRSGLIPGLPDYRVAITIEESQRTTASSHVRLYEDYQFNAFTRKLSQKNIFRNDTETHAGKFVIPPGLLFEMQIQGLTVFQYCEPSGNILESENIAAVSNKMGNVMAMLFQPEWESWGDLIFQSMYDYLVEGVVPNVTPLHYFPRQIKG